MNMEIFKLQLQYHNYFQFGIS